ncbi:MAG: methyltransferase domain-containing protein [Candidatus Uhrbacteria bacterium]|nr:methyltransferase domain-containing protein [Candidatus Uhrbacteria bacterium]
MQNIPNLEERYRDHGRYFQGQYRPEGIRSVEQLSKKFSFFQSISNQSYLPKSLWRYLLVADEFKQEIQNGSILDVGNRDESTRQVLGDRCQLVDKNNPNLPVWNWEEEALPYPDQSFDSVVCLDTLEHIDRFHYAFEDVLRVAKEYVVISLPNCWRKMFKAMLLGRGTSSSYGLPLESPMDRHRWFFNVEEIEHFLFYQSAVSTYPFDIVRFVYHLPITIPRHRIQYGLMRLMLPEHQVKNLVTGTVFVLLKKRRAEGSIS